GGGRHGAVQLRGRRRREHQVATAGRRSRAVLLSLHGAMASRAGGTVHPDPRGRRALCRDDPSPAAASHARRSVRHGHAAARHPGRADALVAAGRDDVPRFRGAGARARGDRPLQRDGLHRRAADTGDGCPRLPRGTRAGPDQTPHHRRLAGRRGRNRDRGHDRARRGSVARAAPVPGVAARSARLWVRGGGAAGHDGVGELRALAAGGAGRSDGGFEIRVMDTLLGDLRYALRQLARSPGFTLVAVLTLALGAGANSLLFSVIYAVLLRPLPYPDPDRILSVGLAPEDKTSARALGGQVPHWAYLAWQDESRSFAELAAYRPAGPFDADGPGGEPIRGAEVTPRFFAVLGVQPALGRTFTADEQQGSGPAVMLLSYGLWQRRFGGDSGIVGRSMVLDGAPVTITGVLPASFDFPSGASFWRPVFPLPTSGGRTWTTFFVRVLGRLAPGVGMTQARTELTVLLAHAKFSPPFVRDAAVDVMTLHERLYG